jgi:NADH-quinone oxidoreductase subunit C
VKVDAASLLSFLKENHAGKLLGAHSQTGDATLIVRRESVLPLFASLKEEPLVFDFLMDVTAVDYPERKERFEVVYHLYSLAKNHRLRVKVPLLADSPEVHSLVSLWKSANWLEREVWDMYGIRFLGHPDLRRILMYEEFQGHPLRKDYPADLRQPLVEERPVEGTFCDMPYRK